MKTITTSLVRKILKNRFSGLRHIWIFDRKLALLPDEQAEEVLKRAERHKKQLEEILRKEFEASKKALQFKDQLFDCDEYAVIALAFVKLEIAMLDLSHTWAFGEISLVAPEKGVHNQNFFITEDLKVKLYEPQANKIILPSKGETVFYVRI